MTSARRLLLASLVLGASGAAHAANPDDAGWYVGASVGRASIDIPGSAESEETAFAFHGGYRVSRHFAIEAGYADQGSESLVIPCPVFVSCPPGAYPLVAGQSFSRTDLSLVGMLPLGERFELYAKIGQAQSRYDPSISRAQAELIEQPLLKTGPTTSSELLYGIGGRWHFDPNWSVRLQWDRTRLPDIDLRVYSAQDPDVESLWLGVEYQAHSAVRERPASGTGWYLGGSVGRSTGDDYLWGAHDYDAYAVHGGYRLGRYLAVEAGFADLGTNVRVYNCAAGVGCSPFLWPRTLTQSITRVDVSLVGVVPLGNRFDAFAKLGQARLDYDNSFERPSGRSEQDENHDGTHYAVGGRWHFRPDWSLRVQWDRTDTGHYELDVDGYSLGVEYRFAR